MKPHFFHLLGTLVMAGALGCPGADPTQTTQAPPNDHPYDGKWTLTLTDPVFGVDQVPFEITSSRVVVKCYDSVVVQAQPITVSADWIVIDFGGCGAFLQGFWTRRQFSGSLQDDGSMIGTYTVSRGTESSMTTDHWAAVISRR